MQDNYIFLLSVYEKILSSLKEGLLFSTVGLMSEVVLYNCRSETVSCVQHCTGDGGE